MAKQYSWKQANKKKKTKMAVWERKKKERKQITGKICTQTRAQSS